MANTLATRVGMPRAWDIAKALAADEARDSASTHPVTEHCPVALPTFPASASTHVAFHARVSLDRCGDGASGGFRATRSFKGSRN